MKRRTIQMKMQILLVAGFALAGVALADGESDLRDSIPEIFAKSAAHYKALDAAATPLMRAEDGSVRIPHGWKAAEGKLNMRSVFQWTSGHYPGSLWLLYEATGDSFFRDRALAWTKLLAPNAKTTNNHDVGFIMLCSYGNAARLLKTDEFDALLVETAGSLSKRFFAPLGLIRSWGAIEEKKEFLVIPDNLMNLELLEWASKHGGDRRFDEIARSHANMTAKHHYRADGGCYHVLDYDQERLCVKGIKRGQGLGPESSWSRGQGWSVYGFTMMYRETKDAAFLKRAMACADFILARPDLPDDAIPYWDYAAIGQDRDSSAAAVTASGLIELSTFAPDDRAKRYRALAVRMLRSLSSPAYFASQGENGDWLLKHGTGHLPAKSEIDTPLSYGDYYFLEALLRLKALN